MSSLDIILPRFFLKNASNMTSIDILKNKPKVNQFFTLETPSFKFLIRTTVR